MGVDGDDDLVSFQTPAFNFAALSSDEQHRVSSLEDSSRRILVLIGLDNGLLLVLEAYSAQEGLLLNVVSCAQEGSGCLLHAAPDDFNHAVFLTGFRGSNNDRSDFADRSLGLFVLFVFFLGLLFTGVGVKSRVTFLVAVIAFLLLVSRFDDDFNFLFDDRLEVSQGFLISIEVE